MWEEDHERGVILNAFMDAVNLECSSDTALLPLLWKDLILEGVPGSRMNTLYSQIDPHLLVHGCLASLTAQSRDMTSPQVCVP